MRSTTRFKVTYFVGDLENHMVSKFWTIIRSRKLSGIRTMANNSVKLIEDSFENIRAHLSKFEGGHVSMVKDASSGVATIFLDHPEKRNAISGQMMVELRDCVETLTEWKEGKAVILTGKGNNFCSGADLDFVKATGNPKAGLNICAWMQDALNRLHKLPLISVCLIRGPSLGGGAEISVFCDYIVAADNVKYGFVHGKMGIIPAFGGGVSLVRKVGQRKALDLLLTAKILTANECVDIGLAETVVPAEEALAKTVEWLTPRLQHHHTVIQAMKEIVLNTCSHTNEDALILEKFRFAPFWGSEINQEALKKNIKHVKKSKI